MKVCGFPENSLLPKSQLKFYFLTVCQHWLGIADPKNVCCRILNNFYLVEFSTDWLDTVWCHFIPETYLFTNHSSSIACVMVLLKLSFVLLCIPFLSPLPGWWQFALWLWCKTWASAILAGALLTYIILCLEY